CRCRLIGKPPPFSPDDDGRREKSNSRARQPAARRSALQLLDDLGQQGRVVLLLEMVDSLLWDLQVAQGRLDVRPDALPLLALGQVEIADQLGQPLQGGRVEVLVVALDDLLLVRAEVCWHGTSPAEESGPGEEGRKEGRREIDRRLILSGR